MLEVDDPVSQRSQRLQLETYLSDASLELTDVAAGGRLFSDWIIF